MRLTVRRERRRDAIDQHGGARRQARSQAAHADVEGNVAATGTVGVLHLHARNTFEYVADVHRALLDHGFAADHGSCPGVVLHHGGIGVAEPVTDDLDVSHAQFQWTAGRRCWCRHQRHRTFIDLVLQAAALQQLAQCVFRRKVAIHRRGLLAGNQFRAEEHLKRGLLAQLTQGLSQGLRRDADGIGGKGLGQRNVDRQREGQR
ncbi:hypothetical protein D3C86_1187850 [compost metagenome]